MEQLVVADIVKIFGRLKDEAAKNKEYYIELDAAMGDGDLGLTMLAAFGTAYDVAKSFGEADIGQLCMTAGMAMSKAAPSTMGTLMATGFMRGGKAVKGSTSLDLPGNADFWKAFVDGMMDRGKSKPGEKTIIDALYPAAQALHAAASASSKLSVAYLNAKRAAARGLDETRTMVAQHGRAAYYGEKSKAKQDPGATVGCMVVSVFADYVAADSQALH